MLQPQKTPWYSKIKNKLVVSFALLLAFILVVIILPWGMYIQHQAQKDTLSLAQQQLDGLDQSISTLIKNKSNNIDIIMLNRSFEALLESEDLDKQRGVYDTLMRVLVHDLDLESAAWFGLDDPFVKTAGSYRRYDIDPDVIQSEPWAAALENAQGDMVCMLNGGGAMEMVSNNAEPYISFVRTVNSVMDFRPLGVVLLNITANQLGEQLQDQMGGVNSQVYLFDSEKTPIARTPNALLEDGAAMQLLGKDEGARILTVEGKRSVVCQKESQTAGWKLLSVTPLENTKTMTQNYSAMLLATALLCVFVIFVGQIIFTRTISRPLEEMCVHMGKVEMGEFVPIQPKNKDAVDEITQLQLFFNHMIRAIDDLLKNVAEKEKMKRRHEVALLQEQIKPHFLYNALDAISALTLTEDNQTAYTMTTALSAFYRTSLSGGYDTVTVRTELDCVKNYLTVLNIRYKNTLCVLYDIEPGIEEEQVLKLILQPLVENAVYHGIRHRKGAGNIHIVARRQGERLLLSVEDDGAGMDEERIRQVLQKQSREQKKGFGLYSMMEKLNLFYEEPDLMVIESAPGQGTTVTLLLPRREGGGGC